jgi:hypothetical protein
LIKTDKKKSRAITGANFVNEDQVLSGGYNKVIAVRIYHTFSEGFKSADMVE